MAKSGSSFGRGKARYKPQPTVLVICEDSKSGKRYIEDATKYFRVNVSVRVVHVGHTDPKGIVEEALVQAKFFDQVFCAIDRDTHENFDEALVLARSSAKISVIASYPCIEFWYLLHFGFTRKAYARAGNRSPADCCIDDLRGSESMSRYDKGSEVSVFASLLPRFSSARQTAARVLAQALAEGELNPSTRIHSLMAFFESLSVPQPL